MMTNLDFPNTGYVRAKQNAKFFGIGLSTWWLWVREGKAPPGIKLSSRTTVWKAEAIHRLSDELEKGAQK
jgi:predicted DNA-binding transcriptional regulator AlpA